MICAARAWSGFAAGRRRAGAWHADQKTSPCAVYDAVTQDPLFAMHHTEPNPNCPVGTGIRPALHGLYRGAEQALRKELARMSIADVLRETLRGDGTDTAGGAGRSVPCREPF